ncbi:NmrA-like family protein [Aureobasidium pullulans]|uniref:NmrA-like family protein n=1 Tax=Aureobasidium pullulans TaxID=5580 RepID=A0A4S9RVD1_AURPU|nr:NmrA-like family protein [Aureobasidium pullulans]THZ02254.1 NmrA-like family protein [Aureobasidium pullulans]TIA25739.1 NmrA-like family protein [Aureobasidium pullulans]
MSIKNVVLVGADGNLGPGVLDGLVSTGAFNVTVFKRKSSKSKSNYSEGVQVKLLSDDFPIDELVPALQNQDAIVSTVYGAQVDLQKRLADAAIKAGVKRFIPSDFGSCDSQSKRAMELAPIYIAKSEVRDYLEKLAKENSGFSWTSLVCGHFFDWDLGFFHIDLKAKSFEILDDGEVYWSTSTFAQIGKATAAILQKPEETKNRFAYIQSFRINQNQLLRAFEKTTGESWNVKKYDSSDYVKERKAKADGGEKSAVEDLVWVLGTLEADWEAREGYANDLLGLKQENLEEVVARIVKNN